jgi:hypothetical protein
MLLLIDSALTEPPSSITLFRDITLFANVFKNRDVLLESRNSMKDFYYDWLKSQGAFDFVSDIVPYHAEKGLSIRCKYDHCIGSIMVKSIGYHNFSRILGSI